MGEQGQLMEAMVLEKSSLMELELPCSPPDSMAPDCKSDREGVELMSDRAGERVLDRSVRDPDASFSRSLLVSPPVGELAAPCPFLSASCCCFRRLRRYLARAFWNHTCRTEKIDKKCNNDVDDYYYNTNNNIDKIFCCWCCCCCC